MAASWKSKITVGGLVGIAAVAALFALQARRMPERGQVTLESGAITVYKTPT